MSTMDEEAVRQLPVRFVMSPEVLGIVPAAPLDVALRMMAQARVRHLPVVDGGRCVGLLYQSDVLWRLWSTAGAGRLASGVVARVPAPCVEVTDNVCAAARRMTELASDALLVLDDGEVVGILTAVNLVWLLASGEALGGMR